MKPFVCLADIHLQTSNKKNISSEPRLRWDTFIYFHQAVSIAGQIKAYILSAGDLFHQSHFSPKYFKVFGNILYKYQRLFPKGKLLYILGNHDNKEDWLSVFDQTVHVDVAKQIWTTSDGVSVGGIDYVDIIEDWERKWSLIPENMTIGMFHQMWNELIPHGEYYLADLGNKISGLSLAGHIHVRYLQRHQSALVFSPGCLFPTSASDQKQDTIGVYHPGKKEIEFYKLYSRDYVYFKFYDNEGEYDNIKEQIQRFSERKKYRNSMLSQFVKEDSYIGIKGMPEKTIIDINEPFIDIRICLNENADFDKWENSFRALLSENDLHLYRIRKTRLSESLSNISELIFLDNEKMTSASIQDLIDLIDKDNVFLTTSNSKRLAKLIATNDLDDKNLRQKIMEVRDAYINQ